MPRVLFFPDLNITKKGHLLHESSFHKNPGMIFLCHKWTFLIMLGLQNKIAFLDATRVSCILPSPPKKKHQEKGCFADSLYFLDTETSSYLGVLSFSQLNEIMLFNF